MNKNKTLLSNVVEAFFLENKNPIDISADGIPSLYYFPTRTVMRMSSMRSLAFSNFSFRSLS